MSTTAGGMRPWWTDRDRRDASSAWLAITLPGLVLASAAAVGVAWAHGGFRPLTQLPTWVSRQELILAGIAALVVMVAWMVVGARWLWPKMAPTGEGFATRADVHRELSEQAARKKAAVTRPGLSRTERRRAPVEQVGTPFHRAPWGQDLFLPLENPSGVIAPTQSGKSLTDLLHKVLAAPGALLVTSTKLDLFRLTAMWRERLHGEGSVAVLDLTGTTGWPFQVRWDPLTGCEKWRTATRRAKAFVAGIRPGQTASGNHAFFEGRAGEVLACYLQAARISQAPLDVFIGWCMDDADPAAADILLADPVTRDHGMMLRKSQNLVQETRDGIWESVRDAISCLTDPLTREMCVGGPEATGFDVGRFLANKGTVYVLGSEQLAADLAPLVTAFVENILFEATQLALTQGVHDGRERLDPPLTVVLDELPNICPLPTLPSTISDSAGRGILIHWAAQTRAQLVTAFDAEGSETLIDNTTALTVFGGLKSEETLTWLSTLCGKRIEERRGRTSSILKPHLDRQISQDKVEVLTAGEIRQLPAGRVLVSFRAMAPLIAVTRKGWELPEWKQLQADRATVIARARDQITDTVDLELQGGRPR